MRVRSIELIREMAAVARDGDNISGPKDDRVVAAAFAAYMWKKTVRGELIARRVTRDSELARKRANVRDQIFLFNQNHLGMLFAQKQQERNVLQRKMARDAWRYRR
jgi:hypothetical protein